MPARIRVRHGGRGQASRAHAHGHEAVEITVGAQAVDGRRRSSSKPRSRTSLDQVGASHHPVRRRQGQDVRAARGEGRPAPRIVGLKAWRARFATTGPSCSITPPRPWRAAISRRCSFAACSRRSRALMPRSRIIAASSTAPAFGPDDLKSLTDIDASTFTVKADLRDNYPFGLFAVPREDLVRLHAFLGNDRQTDRCRLYPGRPRLVGRPDGPFARLHGRQARRHLPRCLADTDCSPAGSNHYGAERLGHHRAGLRQRVRAGCC